MNVRENDEDYKNPVNLMFEALETLEPQYFAVRQYKQYKLAAGVTEELKASKQLEWGRPDEQYLQPGR